MTGLYKSLTTPHIGPDRLQCRESEVTGSRQTPDRVESSPVIAVGLVFLKNLGERLARQGMYVLLRKRKPNGVSPWDS